MFENKARNRFHPDAEAFDASRDGERHAYFDRGADGYLVAANVQVAGRHVASDAELLAIIQKMLDGDPYPVSGHGRPVVPEFEAVEAVEPLTDRIRGILRNRPIGRETTGEHEPEPAPIPEFTFRLPNSDTSEIDLSPSAPTFPILPTELASRNRWSFGLGSIVFVVALSAAGVWVPTMLAPPPRFISQATLQMEAQGPARQALLTVAAKRAISPSLLSDVVARLKLDREPEFTGSETGAVGVAMDLLFGSGNASDAPSRAQATLRQDIVADADLSSGMLRLSVTTGNSARSADIANRLANAVIGDAAVAQGTGVAGRGIDNADPSRKAYDEAKSALEAFIAENGEDKIKAAQDLEQRRQQLDGQIKAAAIAVRNAKAGVLAAKSATPATVLSGTLSSDLSAAGLDDLRSRYSAATTVLSQLSAQLGPRHPRLLAQQATVDGLAADIRAQLQRLVAGSDASLRTALDNQTALSAQMTALGQQNAGVDMTRLAQLQDDVATAQTRYEADQQNADAIPAEAPVPITVVAPAVAAGAPLDDNLAGRQTAGFLLGLGLAICLVFLRKWMGGALISDDHAGGQIAPPAPVLDRDIDPVSLPMPSLELPQTRFNTAVPVANDRPAASDEVTQIQRELASLRAKVATYASHRNAARG